MTPQAEIWSRSRAAADIECGRDDARRLRGGSAPGITRAADIKRGGDEARGPYDDSAGRDRVMANPVYESKAGAAPVGGGGGDGQQRHLDGAGAPPRGLRQRDGQGALRVLRGRGFWRRCGYR